MSEKKLAKNKIKKIIVVVVVVGLSLLMLGLGHISCGKIKRGVIIYLASLLIVLLAIIILIKPIPPFNIIIPAFMIICLYAFSIVDAIIIAKDPENKLRVKPIIGYFIITALWLVNSYILAPYIANTVKQDFIQAYKIPSGSMIPTLLIGDHLLADKNIYQHSAPKRGDIVIFPYPVDPQKDYIERVIAMGGDTIQIKEKQVYLNGKLLSEPYAVHADSHLIPAEQYPRDFFGPVTVPHDSVFTMGDNRDYSRDSRFWGFVKKETIKAKVINLYWSWDKEVGKVRWNRIGQAVSATSLKEQ